MLVHCIRCDVQSSNNSITSLLGTRILSTGSILTYVGNGTHGYSGDGGPAALAKISTPQGVAIDPSTGDLYMSDYNNNVIRMVAKSTGIVTTVAGNGLSGYNGDGMLATSSRLSGPIGIAIDPSTSDLYIADFGNRIIRLVTKSTGVISTIAGTGYPGYSGDGGLATNATFTNPEGVDVDPSTGNFYVTDEDRGVARMITKSTGIITTIGGTGVLRFPKGIAVAAVTGNIYIADDGNNVIRVITKSTGIISKFAGTGGQGYSGDGGPATSARLYHPRGIAIDALSGNIYIADTYNNAIRMVAKSTGIITTVAGTRRSGYSGDGGQATLAMLSHPYSMAIDASSGMMYIADSENNVVRSVIVTLDVTSRPSASPVSRPPTAIMSAPTPAPSSAGEILDACLWVYIHGIDVDTSSNLTDIALSTATPVPSRAPSIPTAAPSSAGDICDACLCVRVCGVDVDTSMLFRLPLLELFCRSKVADYRSITSMNVGASVTSASKKCRQSGKQCPITIVLLLTSALQ